MQKTSKTKLIWAAIPLTIFSCALVAARLNSTALPNVHIGEFKMSDGAEYAGNRAAIKKLSALLNQYPHTNTFVVRWQENMTEAKAFVQMVYKRDKKALKIDDEPSGEPEQYVEITVKKISDQIIHKAASRSEYYGDLGKYKCPVVMGGGGNKWRWE